MSNIEFRAERAGVAERSRIEQNGFSQKLKLVLGDKAASLAYLGELDREPY